MEPAPPGGTATGTERLRREIRSARDSVDQSDGAGLLKRLYQSADRGDIAGGASEMAFRFFLAAIPFLLFLSEAGTVLAGLVNIHDPTGEIMALIEGSLPEEPANVVRAELQGVLATQRPGLLSLAFIGALMLSASGMMTIMKNMNRAYGVEETRPYVRRYLMAVGLSLAAGTLIVASLAISIVGQVWGYAIADELGLAGVARELLPYARFPLVIGMVLVAASLIFWAAPDAGVPLRWVTPGTALFIACWVMASYAYGYYVANVAAYGVLYGTVGSVVVSLMWFYITALVLLLGGHVNALLVREAVPEALPEEARVHEQGQDERARSA